jgi:hypothetical protein
VRYNAFEPGVYRSFGFPGADEMGNVFQADRGRSLSRTRLLPFGSPVIQAGPPALSQRRRNSNGSVLPDTVRTRGEAAFMLPIVFQIDLPARSGTRTAPLPPVHPRGDHVPPGPAPGAGEVQEVAGAWIVTACLLVPALGILSFADGRPAGARAFRSTPADERPLRPPGIPSIVPFIPSIVSPGGGAPIEQDRDRRCRRFFPGDHQEPLSVGRDHVARAVQVFGWPRETSRKETDRRARFCAGRRRQQPGAKFSSWPCGRDPHLALPCRRPVSGETSEDVP